MKRLAALALLLCAACSQQDAPAEQIVENAEKLVDPAASPSPLAKGRFAPHDTCAEVEGANAFRRALAEAVKARDADGVVALAAEDIKLDFGGGSGTAELRTRLAETSWGLWDELAALMDLGCAANEQGGITIPWYFEQDFGTVDPFAGMLVTGEDVPVLQRPDAASRRVGAISWDVVEIASLKPDDAFQQVELADGKVGFIATDKLRSLIDYRLVASSRNGKWRITALIAGD